MIHPWLPWILFPVTQSYKNFTPWSFRETLCINTLHELPSHVLKMYFPLIRTDKKRLVKFVRTRNSCDKTSRSCLLQEVLVVTITDILTNTQVMCQPSIGPVLAKCWPTHDQYLVYWPTLTRYVSQVLAQYRPSVFRHMTNTWYIGQHSAKCRLRISWVSVKCR